MSGVQIQKPILYTTKKVFLFWLKNLEKEKPYLLIKCRNSRGLEYRTTEVWYTVKHEIDYLGRKILEADEEIMRLEQEDRDKYRFTSKTIRIFELKKEIYRMRDKIDQLSKADPEEKRLLMTYKLFHDIVCLFNKKAAHRIVQGEILNLGNRIGYLQIRKMNQHSPSIDWPASNARRQELVDKGIRPRAKDYQEGENWLVYRDSEFYLRWSWVKQYRKHGYHMLRNTNVYAFYPTHRSAKGVPGTKNLLSKANHDNPLLHLRYEIIKPL